MMSLVLTHATMVDKEKKPKKVNVVFGPGLVYFRSNDIEATMVTTVGGALTVLETVEEVTAMLNKNQQSMIL